jgi:hypothetical protein
MNFFEPERLTNIKNVSCTILQNIQNYKKFSNRTEEEEEEDE